MCALPPCRVGCQERGEGGSGSRAPAPSPPPFPLALLLFTCPRPRSPTSLARHARAMTARTPRLRGRRTAPSSALWATTQPPRQLFPPGQSFSFCGKKFQNRKNDSRCNNKHKEDPFSHGRVSFASGAELNSRHAGAPAHCAATPAHAMAWRLCHTSLPASHPLPPFTLPLWRRVAWGGLGEVGVG